MDFLIGIAVFALLAALVAFGIAASRPTKSITPDTSCDDDPYAEEDARFENELSRRVPDMERHFYTKVVGITFENQQGVTGEMLIGYCKQFDFLQLVPEPNNRFDPNAVAVCLDDGSCIGHLDARTAGEISRSIKRGYQWRACVKLAQRATARRHGCVVLCLIETAGTPTVSTAVRTKRRGKTQRTTASHTDPDVPAL